MCMSTDIHITHKERPQLVVGRFGASTSVLFRAPVSSFFNCRVLTPYVTVLSILVPDWSRDILFGGGVGRSLLQKVPRLSAWSRK
jgi:hypothetical protein